MGKGLRAGMRARAKTGLRVWLRARAATDLLGRPVFCVFVASSGARPARTCRALHLVALVRPVLCVFNRARRPVICVFNHAPPVICVFSRARRPVRCVFNYAPPVLCVVLRSSGPSSVFILGVINHAPPRICSSGPSSVFFWASSSAPPMPSLRPRLFTNTEPNIDRIVGSIGRIA